MAGELAPCCADPANRSEPALADPEKPELTVTVCKECGRRHFELDLDKVELVSEASVL